MNKDDQSRNDKVPTAFFIVEVEAICRAPNVTPSGDNCIHIFIRSDASFLRKIRVYIAVIRLQDIICGWSRGRRRSRAGPM
jgi:hypothetical protein